MAALESDIAKSEAATREATKKHEESFQPKPAGESLTPGFVTAAAAYRDEKKREVCDTDSCGAVQQQGTLVFRKSTSKGKRDALRVFTRFPNERVTCEQLGSAEVKRKWETPSQIKYHCALTGGTLSGLFAEVDQEKQRPETQVVVFSAAWLERDEKLRAALAETGSDAAAP